MRYLCLATVSAHESRLRTAVQFVEQIEEMEARAEAAKEAEAEKEKEKAKEEGGEEKEAKSSFPFHPTSLVVSLLGSDTGKDDPPLVPLEGGEAAAESTSFPRPGSPAHEASVQALREALRLLSREEASCVLRASGGDPHRALLSELLAWRSGGGRSDGAVKSGGGVGDAEEVIGELAREYAAARGLGAFGGSASGGSGGCDDDDADDDDADDADDDASPGGGGGAASRTSKKR